MWARNGRELFYLDGSKTLTAVPVQTSGPTFSAGTPVKVFDTRRITPSRFARHYDVSPDGQRFLMIKNGAGRSERNGGQHGRRPALVRGVEGAPAAEIALEPTAAHARDRPTPPSRSTLGFCQSFLVQNPDTVVQSFGELVQASQLPVCRPTRRNWCRPTPAGRPLLQFDVRQTSRVYDTRLWHRWAVMFAIRRKRSTGEMEKP